MVKISSARIDMEGARVDRAVLKDYGEKVVGGQYAVVTSSLDIDLSQGNTFHYVLGGNCTITFSNPSASGVNSSFTLILQQDPTGSRTVSWPSRIFWSNQTEPTLSTAARNADIFTFTTNNGGDTWLGFVAIQNVYADSVADTHLFAWGTNSYGILGLNDTVSRSRPTTVGADESPNWSSIVSGSNATFAIKTGGTLWTWGYNQSGRLGLNSTTDYSSPVQVGILNNWSQVSQGQGSHTAAIKTDGTLWAWGLNSNGQVGDNTATTRSSPVQIGTLTTWGSVSAGGKHTTAIKSDGTLWAWGYNTQGNLGDNSTTTSSSPVQIGTDTTWSSLSVGNHHNVAVKTDGTLWAWGFNSEGQVGDGSTTSRSSPVQVGTLTTWTRVSAGPDHTAAIKTDGTLWAWGDNGQGQLGLNISFASNRSSPVQVGTLTTWSKVSTGIALTSAIKTDGTLWAWGDNTQGQLGLNISTTLDRSSPVQVGTLTTWSLISAGSSQAVAVKTDNTLWAWGDNSKGQLGHNTATTLDRSSPVMVGEAVGPWAKVSVGTSHAGGTKTNGSLWAWGRNNFGQLGLNSGVNQSVPVQVGALTDWGSEIAMGAAHTVAIKNNGTLWSWGIGSALGQNNTTDRSSPVQIGTLTTWSKVATKGNHTLAIKTDGTLWAWGFGKAGNLGEIGDGTTISRSSPVQIGTLTTWSQISASGHSTAIKTDGTLWAWGDNGYGQLGHNTATTLDRSSPVQVGTLTTWSKVAAGARHTAAVKTDGTLWAWGRNLNGELGHNGTTARSSPVQVGTLTTWSDVFAGTQMTAAVKTDGTLWAWGVQGRVGDNTNITRSSPVQVGTRTDWSQVAAYSGVLGLTE